MRSSGRAPSPTRWRKPATRTQPGTPGASQHRGFFVFLPASSKVGPHTPTVTVEVRLTILAFLLDIAHRPGHYTPAIATHNTCGRRCGRVDGMMLCQS